jgi:hypothetical protein
MKKFIFVERKIIEKKLIKIFVLQSKIEQIFFMLEDVII